MSSDREPLAPPKPILGRQFLRHSLISLGVSLAVGALIAFLVPQWSRAAIFSTARSSGP